MFSETVWKDGEKLVVEFMKKNGYEILYTNFSCVGVELDIVAKISRRNQIKLMKREYKQKLAVSNKLDRIILKKSFNNLKKTIDDLIVVTEVKSRSSDKFGVGSEAISEYKKNNIIRGARFMQTLDEFKGYSIRFDVASVDMGRVTYIADAF